MICIYHSKDLDGWMSAAIVKKRYPDCKLIGWTYGEAVPQILLSEPYHMVVMTDISFKPEEMREVYNLVKGNLIWVDHHDRTIKETEQYFLDRGDKIPGLRDSKFAACELAWKFFFQEDPMPDLVRLLGRYDCFGHKQVWKSVVGYEGLYEVSNQGNVRSLDRTIIENNTDKERSIKGIELSIANSKRGYRVVVLCKDGIEKMKNVHRLVAESFLPNDESKPCINHKDFNRLNNYVNNLEWCTYLENNEHSIKEGSRGKRVFQISTEDNIVAEFDSIIEAEKQTGIQSQNIGKVCRGERETAGGFRWEYNLEITCVKQFVPDNEELRVLQFQYGARQRISSPEEALAYLNEYLTSEYNAVAQIEVILSSGQSIYDYLCTEAKQVYKNRFVQIMSDFKSPESYKFAMVNKERFNPINFGIDYHKDGYDGFCSFWFENGKWIYSLYNDNGQVDCSAIAKAHGGGGHKGASGFQSENAPDFPYFKKS